MVHGGLKAHTKITHCKYKPVMPSVQCTAVFPRGVDGTEVFLQHSQRPSMRRENNMIQYFNSSTCPMHRSRRYSVWSADSIMYLMYQELSTLSQYCKRILKTWPHYTYIPAPAHCLIVQGDYCLIVQGDCRHIVHSFDKTGQSLFKLPALHRLYLHTGHPINS